MTKQTAFSTDLVDHLPMVPDEVTPAWLGQALTQGTGTPVDVSAIEIHRTIWGTTTKLLVNVRYRNAVELPRRLCIKGGFDPAARGVSSDEILLLEARFYGDLAARFAVAAPRSFYAGVTEAGDQGIVILEDLTDVGATFLEPGDAMTVDQVASALEGQARWHASTWGQVAGGLENVPVGSQTRRAVKLFFREPTWSQHFAQPGVTPLPEPLDDYARVFRAYKRLWQLDDGDTHCLLHGDAHVGNTFLDRENNPGFIDWQCYCRGPWSYDVAYFVSGALTVADRRSREEDLLRHYLEALHGFGGPRVSWTQAQLDYARHQLHGLLWTVTPSVMQPLHRSQTMSSRHVTACLDHDSIGLLELP